MSDNSTATQSDQTGAAAGAATTTSDQNAASNSAVSSDQNANAAGQSAGAENNGQASQKKLPQTASPLPFLSLLGMGSLMGGGLLARIRSRK